MALPLIPIAITGLIGLFAGSQIDDAVESPSNTSASNFPQGFSNSGDFFSVGTIFKVTLLGGAVYLASKAYKNLR